MKPQLHVHQILIMRPDQPHAEMLSVALADDPGFQALADLLGPIVGGGIEHVAVLADFHGGADYRQSDMFVNERGALIGLPVNKLASAIYQRAYLMRHPDADADELPRIHGPAVLFERIVWS